MATEPRFEDGDIVVHMGHAARVVGEPLWFIDARQNALWKHAAHWRYTIQFLRDGAEMDAAEGSLSPAGNVVALPPRRDWTVYPGGTAA